MAMGSVVVDGIEMANVGHRGKREGGEEYVSKHYSCVQEISVTLCKRKI